MKAYFLSDIHLKSETKDKAKLFLNFIKNIDKKTTHLILLGDVFDLWIGDHKYFKEKFHQTLSQLRRLVEDGVEVHYFEGNHDIHLKKFWEKRIGVHVHPSKKIFQLGPFKVRAEHGDLMNPQDKGYLFLRWFLRTKPMELLSQYIPGKVVAMIGERSSLMSRIYTSRINKEYIDKVIEYTRAYAKKEYAKDKFDTIITGHTHVKDDYIFNVGSKQIRSVNLGSWLDQPKAFIITPNEQKFISLD